MSPVNTDELEVALMLARQRVLKIRPSCTVGLSMIPHRRFDDLFNPSSPIPPSFWWRGIG